MKKQYTGFLFTGLILIMAFSCKRENPYTPVKGVGFNVGFKVGGDMAISDTVWYKNAAGNDYNFYRLQFYLSDFTFIDSTGNQHKFGDVQYVDYKMNSTHTFNLNELQHGTYNSVSFLIGLTDDKNTTNSLPATIENVNMAWPDMMGGGYHFMKFEGKYKDSTSSPGYAIHLGRNPYKIRITLNGPFNFNNSPYNLLFDLNEVFTNPYIYDLKKDNAHTMSDTSAMRIISSNMTDVFTLKR